ncbi:MAG TPA: glycosyltransferase family 4 protein [Anaerolineales bacterium]|nr:glycosyltransferase family 4 protein [Anaerolineales bacterium]
MKILYVADGRSPIALNWIEYFLTQGHEVHLASTFACDPPLPLASLTWTPVAFSEKKAAHQQLAGGSNRFIWKPSAVRLRTAVRQWLGPLTFPLAARKLSQLIAEIKPDLVHAMRIPYEGMLAALALEGLPPSRFGSAGRKVPPLLVSVWGNDFTLHAKATPILASYTRRTLLQATALHSDCQRDLRLARDLGFEPSRPAVVLPGNGGVRLDWFYPPANPAERAVYPTVINPRGFRAYVRNDTFFAAARRVLARHPEIKFICPSMAGEAQAHRWIAEVGIDQAVTLLPKVPLAQMANLFRQAHVAVSITTHDGTPNTLLEAMACGCYPIAGDLESLHEWITPGVNGMLVDPNDPAVLAEAIITCLQDVELRAKVAQHNGQLVRERASYAQNMEEAARFYRSLIV